MATIIMEYDGRNAAMKKLVEVFIALGGKVTERKNELEKSIEEVEQGRTYKAKSVKDLMDKINA